MTLPIGNQNHVAADSALALGTFMAALTARKLAVEGPALGATIAFPEFAVPIRIALIAANTFVWGTVAYKTVDGQVNFVSQPKASVSGAPEIDEHRRSPHIYPVHTNSFRVEGYKSPSINNTLPAFHLV